MARAKTRSLVTGRRRWPIFVTGDGRCGGWDGGAVCCPRREAAARGRELGPVALVSSAGIPAAAAGASGARSPYRALRARHVVPANLAATASAPTYPRRQWRRRCVAGRERRQHHYDRQALHRLFLHRDDGQRLRALSAVGGDGARLHCYWFGAGGLGRCRCRWRGVGVPRPSGRGGSRAPSSCSWDTRQAPSCGDVAKWMAGAAAALCRRCGFNVGGGGKPKVPERLRREQQRMYGLVDWTVGVAMPPGAGVGAGYCGGRCWRRQHQDPYKPMRRCGRPGQGRAPAGSTAVGWQLLDEMEL